jgi:hypothetical protein
VTGFTDRPYVDGSLVEGSLSAGRRRSARPAGGGRAFRARAAGRPSQSDRTPGRRDQRDSHPQLADRRARGSCLRPRVAHGEPLPPLHGLVIAYKRLHDTAGVRTTCGSPVFADHVPNADHPLIARLRSAGAVMVGKTNTPGVRGRFAHVQSGARDHPKSLGRHPQRRWLERWAAAGVAARMLSLADGSDVGGSLRTRRPSAGWSGCGRPSAGSRSPGRATSTTDSLPTARSGAASPTSRSGCRRWRGPIQRGC